MAHQRTFTWKTPYAEMPVEEMPWYLPGLDSDLEKALKAHSIHSGTFLDLGTDPCTQAIELAKRGFTNGEASGSYEPVRVTVTLIGQTSRMAIAALDRS